MSAWKKKMNRSVHKSNWPQSPPLVIWIHQAFFRKLGCFQRMADRKHAVHQGCTRSGLAHLIKWNRLGSRYWPNSSKSGVMADRHTMLEQGWDYNDYPILSLINLCGVPTILFCDCLETCAKYWHNQKSHRQIIQHWLSTNREVENITHKPTNLLLAKTRCGAALIMLAAF